MAPDRKLMIAGVVAAGGAAALVWSGMRTFGLGAGGREIRAAERPNPQRDVAPANGADEGPHAPRIALGDGDGPGPSWTPGNGETIPPGATDGRRTLRLGGGDAAAEMPDVAREYEFTDAPAGVAGELALDRLERAWRDALDAEAGLSSLGMARREQLAKEARSLLGALKDNDFEAWDSAVRALGAVIPEDASPVREQFDRLTNVLASASLAIGAAGVRAIDPRAPRGMLDMLPNDGFNANIIQRVVQALDEDGKEREIRVSNLLMAGGGLFPGVSKFRDDKLQAAVVRVPVRVKASKSARADGIFSLTMAWNAQANHWQPALWELEIFNQDVLAGMQLRRGG